MLALAAAVVSYAAWPSLELFRHRAAYAEHVRACLLAKQSEAQAQSIALNLAGETRQRLLDAIEVEKVSCDERRRLRYHLLARRVPGEALAEIEFGVSLRLDVPIGARVEDLDT